MSDDHWDAAAVDSAPLADSWEDAAEDVPEDWDTGVPDEWDADEASASPEGGDGPGDDGKSAPKQTKRQAAAAAAAAASATSTEDTPTWVMTQLQRLETEHDRMVAVADEYNTDRPEKPLLLQKPTAKTVYSFLDNLAAAFTQASDLSGAGGTGARQIVRDVSHVLQSEDLTELVRVLRVAKDDAEVREAAAKEERARERAERRREREAAELAENLRREEEAKAQAAAAATRGVPEEAAVTGERPAPTGDMADDDFM
eukprot:TRINITY_DN22847_c0_g1_i1.p1 TRINITY_DN22847_c0_g1~~TRINITY_DN22847_c0_g1_i1.p1  ORF type:complete len:278 (-),score=71.72 TRINITY_DN22847_c0_g1_i1:95-865(-)